MLSHKYCSLILTLLVPAVCAGCLGSSEEVILVPEETLRPTEPTELVEPAEPSEPSNEPGHTVDPTNENEDVSEELKGLSAEELLKNLSDPQMASLASDELADRGEASVLVLTTALAADDTPGLSQVIFTLGRLGPQAESALPRLRELAEDGENEVIRGAAAFAIDAIEGKE